MFGIALTQVQDLALSLVKIHEVYMGHGHRSTGRTTENLQLSYHAFRSQSALDQVTNSNCTNKG